MRLDPTISEKKHAEIRDILDRRLEPGEQALGIFAANRFRRSISYLVVTDHRLLTLGLEYQGYPVMDDLPHASVDEVVLERQSVWRSGEVRALDGEGIATYLGCLSTGRSGAALDLFEEVVEEARSGTGALLPIPTPTAPALPAPTRPGEPSDEAPEDTPVDAAAPPGGAAAPPVGSAAEAPGYLPLVEQLAELGRLHQAGLLTEDEFTTAKAHVLEAAALFSQSSEG